MDIVVRNRLDHRGNGFITKIGFKSKRQLPIIMIFTEEWYGGEVVYGKVHFSSFKLFGQLACFITSTRV